MKRISASDFSTMQKLADFIYGKLNNEGLVIVSHLLETAYQHDELKAQLCKLCNLIGNVTSHNSHNTPVWDIKSTVSTSTHLTFSEHASEAVLHTDSQYSKFPEDYFALYCLSKAECGGGESYFLSVKDIEADLRSTIKGQGILNVLEQSLFPFIVPDIFKKDKDGPVEFTLGYLLNNGQMRFRIDTLEKAIELLPNICTQEQVNAFQFLKDVILNTTQLKKTFLQNNECLFINNKTMLHGRGKFTDVNRHLLRVRFNNKD